MRRIVFLLFFATLSEPLRAGSGLAWEKTVLDLQAAPLAERVDAVFPFTNAGTSPIAIVSIAASCGCTLPQLEKRRYGPGEKGELHALFSPDDRVGLRQEEVMVQTDEPGVAPQVLVLRVIVPKLYDVAPYFVIWHGGEEPVAKEIKIHLLMPSLVTPVAAKSSDSRIVVALEKAEHSTADYIVRVRPVSTATPFQTMIGVNLSTPGGGTRVLNLYAVVRTAPEKTAKNFPTDESTPAVPQP